MSKLMFLILLTVITVSIFGCSAVKEPYALKYAVLHNDFKADSCRVVYCTAAEGDVSRDALFRFVEIAASVYNIEIDLGDGICGEPNSKRELAGGYVYMMKSAREVCFEDEE